MNKKEQSYTISSNRGKLEISMNESAFQRTIKNFINIYIEMTESKYK